MTDGIVWVTGAGKGIGRALALRLAAEGRIVAASARSAGDLDSLAAEAPAGRILPVPLDITCGEEVAAALDRIEAEHGPVTCAVLNAGTHRPMGLADFSPDTLRTLTEVNLLGTANCLAPLFARMQARGAGRIAVVASLAAYRGLPSAAAYGATKAGLMTMLEALRPEADRAGLVLQVINPGFVRTPLTDLNRFPMPFLIEAEDAAGRILHGLGSRRFEIAFPRRFAFIMGLARLLPAPLFFALTRRMLPK